MNDIVTPPDLQTAGAAQPPQDAQSLVGMLRSGGSPPGGLMESLQMSQMTPATMFASAVAGGLNPGGPNPVQQQMQQQQRAQMEQARLIEKVQHQKRQEALAKDKSAFDLLTTIVRDPNSSDDTLKVMGPQYQKKAKDYLGVDVPTSAFVKTVTKDQQDRLLLEIEMDYPDELLQRNHPWAAQELPLWKQMKGNPAILDHLKLKSPDDRKMQLLQIKGHELDNIKKSHPELSDTKFAVYAAEQHFKLNGTGYMDGTPESQAQAAALAKMAMLKDEETKQKRMFQQQVDMEMLREAGREKLLEKRLGEQKTKARSISEQKLKNGLTVARTFLAQFKRSFEGLDSGGFIPADASLEEMYRARAKRGEGMWKIPGYSTPNDPVLRKFQELQANAIGWSRGVQGEIGPRFKQAFEQTMRIISDPPTKEGLEQIYLQMKEQLDAIERDGVDRLGSADSPLTPGLPAPPPGAVPVQKK